MTTPIPQPPAYPYFGHVFSLDRDVPALGFHKLAQELGEIYRLNLIGRSVVFASSHALVNELSDDNRFSKAISGALKETRNLVNDGIFTAYNDEPNWGLAHRLLMPAFGAARIKNMLEDMREICDDMINKWARSPPGTELDPIDDLTRVALETIAFCSMSYRLNSFLSETTPPFVGAMNDCLRECNSRANRPTVVQAWVTATNGKYQDDIRLMRNTAREILEERRRKPTEKNDMLNAMLADRSANVLSDEGIIDNLLTLLIAGHETTSGTMSFAIYYLLKHPETMQKLRNEVDEIIGDQPAEIRDLNKMPYLHAVLREAMRLQPTAAIRVVNSIEDTTIGNGKYFLPKGAAIALLTWDAHRDVAVWGEDAEEFRPERMLNGKFESLPPNAWQPFGYGMRSCIGRSFAWQEMCLVLASIVQHFDLSLADPSYVLEMTQAITIKPKNFYIHAKPRHIKT
ncbi:cytochrome P450 [Dendrothele bispora CBS 962.96]|uniref:Cytochrome P450 n=1 Tax=Dendrothele bispora (strain CBS 962.96) TaxID=1314807 RepID=A0A4S8LMT6_DENBC|nr:cytochrome P450 [Dendrothele bispora CBS 962.96]